jgi:Ca2+-binding EF-hand superfamily protein
MRKHLSVLLVLGCVWSKTAAAEPAPKKPATHHHRATGRPSRAKTASEPKLDLATATRRRRDESRVMLDLLDRVHGDGSGAIDHAGLLDLAQRSVDKRVHARFSQLDKNHDGRISRVEVARMNATRFSRFDLNHDAFITADELGGVMRAKCAERVQQLVARYDADQDGRVTQAEVAPERARDTRVAELATQPDPQAAKTRPAIGNP